ncbi:MAG TPA: precorrin-2 C(20)-methyltransferase [Methanobacterium sp.]|nr:precorrin-2 C(20)-methyltransferase [Methanobacterium sp.]
MKKGKLIGIGVGPGDAELLTIKASKILKNVNVICAPKSAKLKPSLALSIVQNYLDERDDDYELLEPLFPMIEDEKILSEYWDEAAELTAGKLDQGLDVAFITLGDPTIYSTFSYLSQKIQALGFQVEIIPGITSFTGCAATAGLSLGEKDEIIIIIPKVDARLEHILEYGDTFVIMKTSRHLDELEEIVNRDPRDKEIISVQNCGMDDERIFDDFIKDKKYLSTTILKFKKN